MFIRAFECLDKVSFCEKTTKTGYLPFQIKTFVFQLGDSNKVANQPVRFCAASLVQSFFVTKIVFFSRDIAPLFLVSIAALAGNGD